MDRQPPEDSDDLTPANPSPDDRADDSRLPSSKPNAFVDEDALRQYFDQQDRAEDEAKRDASHEANDDGPHATTGATDHQARRAEISDASDGPSAPEPIDHRARLNISPDVCDGVICVDGDPRRPLMDPMSRKPVKPINGFMRYALTIAYDGTEFFGWQKQTTPEGKPLRTVQSSVTDAIKSLLPPQRINLVGASRTDRGVHAFGQVAQFDARSPIPARRLAQALTARLDVDIEVRDVRAVPWSFNSIQGVTNKQYRYLIQTNRIRPLWDRHRVYHCDWPLDIDRMNDAAARMVGTHDVAGLAFKNHGRTSTIRTIFKCHVERVPEDPLGRTGNPLDRVAIVVEGSGFLYNQIRIMAGTLMEVGRGLFEPSRVDEILSTGNRRLAGPTLGPEGLTLMWIKYD